jgi:hypothetical protein
MLGDSQKAIVTQAGGQGKSDGTQFCFSQVVEKVATGRGILAFSPRNGSV